MDQKRIYNGKIRDALCNTFDIVDYLKKLLIYSKEYTIVLSVRDTPGSNLSNAIVDCIFALGFSNFSKELWRMYIGFIDAGNVIYNHAGEAQGKPVFCQALSPGKNDEFSITSRAWKQGDKAEIIINGVDYSVNMRGLNIVVYDRTSHEVLDSIGYDGHDRNGLFVRKNF